MLNKLLERLNGSAGDPESLQGALAQLSQELDAVRVNIGDLNAKRKQALLDDASDTELDKIERQIDRATVRLEKLNLSESPLLERLASAKVEARARRWAAHLEAFLAVAGEFLSAARAAAATHAELLAIRKQAQGEGFEAAAARSMPATPNLNENALLAPDLLDLFELAITPPAPAAAKATRQARPKVAARSRLPHERAPTVSNAHEVLSLAWPSGRPPQSAPRAPKIDDTQPLQAGEARVRVLRSGYSPADDLPQCQYGQLIRMAAEPAQVAAMRGAPIEIIETFSPPAPPAEG